MRNLIETLSGWIPHRPATPAQEQTPGQGRHGSFRTQASGPMELVTRPRPPATPPDVPESSSRPDARRTGRTPLPSAEVLREGLDTWDFIPLHQDDTGAGLRRSPSTSGSDASSDAFLSFTSSARWNVPVNVGSVSRRVEVPVVPDPAVPPPPASRLAVLRAELAAALGDIHFSDTALQDEPAQLALQERYLDRAAQIAERREKAFGTTQPYRLGASMDTQTGEGSVAAAYEGFQSFVTSFFRSPSGGATGLSLVGNKDFFPIDQALTTGIVQGVLAYGAEGGMVAMNNRAVLSNMPKISRNNFEGLFYEHGVEPDTVLLTVTQDANGRLKKAFMRADDPRAPTPEALVEQATRKLSAIKLRQDLLDGKSFAFPLVPLMSGGLNTLRRFLSSASVLASPVSLFVTSGLASGSASGVVKLGLELGKTRAQVQMDDLLGGTQTVNLFRISRPRADVEPVRWSDAGRLLGFLGDTAWESLALSGEAARTFGHSALDLSYRYVLVNGMANAMSVGLGGMVGQLFRKDRHFGALPGESPQSRGNIAGQMTQSTFGDAIWRGMKEVMKGRELDANASLKLRRTTDMAEQLKRAQREQDNLRALAASLPANSAVWAAQPSGDVEAHGSLRSRLLQHGPVDLDTLRGLSRQLAALDLREADPTDRTDRDALKRQLDQVIEPLSSRAGTQQWLRPRE